MKPWVAIALVLTANAASAQFSPDKSMDYLAGAGMGYAKAAELNQFPGPMHVLELADKLGLSEQQRAATQALMDEHKRQARAIGAELVETERTLEAMFRKGGVNESMLARTVREAAALEGEYRLSHLETHRRMRALLTEEQVKRYDVLRGHSAAPPAHQHRHH
jgi:Spy/CpxP family protein refolding chaperone